MLHQSTYVLHCIGSSHTVVLVVPSALMVNYKWLHDSSSVDKRHEVVGLAKIAACPNGVNPRIHDSAMLSARCAASDSTLGIDCRCSKACSSLEAEVIAHSRGLVPLDQG